MSKILNSFCLLSCVYVYCILVYSIYVKNLKLFFCVSLRYEMSGKLHLICMKTEGFQAKIWCNLHDISYLSETQKNNFQFL